MTFKYDGLDGLEWKWKFLSLTWHEILRKSCDVTRTDFIDHSLETQIFMDISKKSL